MRSFLNHDRQEIAFGGKVAKIRSRRNKRGEGGYSVVEVFDCREKKSKSRPDKVEKPTEFHESVRYDMISECKRILNFWLGEEIGVNRIAPECSKSV